MSLIKTECIILHQKPFFEKDCLLDVFSKDLGRVKVLVKGGSSRKSKPDYTLQPFVQANLVLFKGKSFFILQSLDCVFCFPYIRDHFNTISLAGYMVDIVRKSTVIHQPHDRLFCLLSQALGALNQPYVTLNMERIRAQFQTQFLTEEGILASQERLDNRGFIKRFEAYVGQGLQEPLLLPSETLSEAQGTNLVLLK